MEEKIKYSNTPTVTEAPPNSGISHTGTLSQARNYQHRLPPLVPWKGGEEHGSEQNRIEGGSYGARARIHSLGCIDGGVVELRSIQQKRTEYRGLLDMYIQSTLY